MSLILHIETAVTGASICLSQDQQLLSVKQNQEVKDSAGWLHGAIQNLLEEHTFTLSRLDAISVSAGPGSYTGLRVGMATAKGLCYTLQIPLISIGTLDIMAAAARPLVTTDLLCPMIDARRMEVFTAVYDKEGSLVVAPQNSILDENSFSEILQSQPVTFFGNGSTKWSTLPLPSNACFKDIAFSAAHMIELALASYRSKSFTDLAYSEPFYLKEFFNTQIAHSIQKKC